MPNLTPAEFLQRVSASRHAFPGRTLAVPLCRRIIADQLTPVVAYRRLVAPDQRTAPSFLLESVEGGERQGRYSILGSQPAWELTAREGAITITNHRTGHSESSRGDPIALLRRRLGDITLVETPGLPACFWGGLVGYASYDSVRYGEPGSLPLARAPRDDRHLPDVSFGLYDGAVVFDHVAGQACVVCVALVHPGDGPAAAYDAALACIDARIAQLDRHTEPLRSGVISPASPGPAPASNMTPEQHAAMVGRALEFIRAGDVFQVVLGQRFERSSPADPFDVYRALRAVNPSPYMVYMQTPGCILIASSPEILCRVRREGDSLVVTNRPLAGTRRRGKDPAEDVRLERELLADAKERAEHIMLVDLGRNDVGVVAQPGTVALPALMEVERYSHVMHISSTVTGRLRAGLDCWDALRAALPVGTISGAPKIRAMQIIDQLEPVRRGPYGGGIGYVSLAGDMDIALALRTIVCPTAQRTAAAWTYHLQASGGIVADSVIADEFQETVHKSAAMARAIDLAERAFSPR